jgi:hypothetical protein
MVGYTEERPSNGFETRLLPANTFTPESIFATPQFLKDPLGLSNFRRDKNVIVLCSERVKIKSERFKT